MDSSNLVIRLEITRGQVRGVIVAALMSACAGTLYSEQMVLTSYYPSPAGVYRWITSTQQTILARDSGNVGIGTGNPTSKVHVNGRAAADDFCLNDGSACLGDTKLLATVVNVQVPVALGLFIGTQSSGCGEAVCAGWTAVAGAVVGPLTLQAPTEVLAAFTGNYGCAGCGEGDAAQGAIRLQLSTNGGPFQDVYTSASFRVESAGTDVSKRAKLTLGAGSHRLRLAHRASSNSGTPISLTEGVLSLER